MSKVLVLMLFALLMLSSLVMVGYVSAQSIPKPSVPEFTVILVAHPYSVPPTYETDPDTGEKVLIAEGYLVENKSIAIRIKNQPFSYSNNGLTYHLYYNVRTKSHIAENWTELFPLTKQPSASYWVNDSWSYSMYLFPDYQNQSDSDYTILDYPLKINDSWFFVGLPSAALDFQVEAMVGHDSKFWAFDFPSVDTFRGHYEPAIAFDESSGWSDTQTLTITEIQTPSPEPTPTPESTPTPTPTEEPQQTKQDLTTGAVLAVASIAVFLGLLFYIIKRK